MANMSSRDGVMACEMSIKDGHFVWLPWQNLHVGNY